MPKTTIVLAPFVMSVSTVAPLAPDEEYDAPEGAEMVSVSVHRNGALVATFPYWAMPGERVDPVEVELSIREEIARGGELADKLRAGLEITEPASSKRERAA